MPFPARPFSIVFAVALILALPTNGHAIEFINAGKGGNNTRHLLKRVDEVLAEHQPDMVLLMVGTNDALNSKAMVPIDEYRENLEALITKITEAGAEPMLMTILPCHAPYVITRHGEEAFADSSPGDRIDAVNEVIRELATEHKLGLVDLNHLFTANNSVSEEVDSLIRNVANSESADGVHPTPQGYLAIASAIYIEFSALDYYPRKVVCLGDSITFGAHVEGAGTAEGETYPAQLKRILYR